MAYLYQAIKNVPGLTGSGFSRQQQLYQKLGAPMGTYRGTTAQNSWLLGQINKGNYGAAPKPAAVKPTTTTPNSLAQQYAEMAGSKAVAKGPVFGEVLPFYQAWNKLLPTVQQEAESQVNPFVQRELQQNLGQYTNQMASSGGGRFGRGWGGTGSIIADSMRNRTAQIQDWLTGRQQGFKELFYDPTEQAYNRALELGQTPNAPTVPTWDQFTKGLSQPTSQTSTTPFSFNNIYKPQPL